jgi:endonuclease I
MRKLFLSALLLLSFRLAFPQIPPGYYDPANGLTGQALQTALHNIIKGHTWVNYNTLMTCFQSTDKKSPDIVWDMYSDVPGGTPPYIYHYNAGQECGNYNSEGDCFNREHSWPKSWFGGEVYPMYSDLFHLYPTDGYVNGKRDNYPYGEVGSATWTSQNGSRLGNCSWPGYSGTVFEPIDEYKGDLARGYFYMSVRYYTEDSGWPGSEQTVGSQLRPWALAMMIQWSTQDPVSTKETNRNNAVYQIQNNRNPFIDHPEYVNLIWGTGTGVSATGEVSPIVYPNPVREKCYIVFGENKVPGKESVRVTNLTGIPVSVPVSVDMREIAVDFSLLPAGIYVLSVVGTPWHFKMVRE